MKGEPNGLSFLHELNRIKCTSLRVKVSKMSPLYSVIGFLYDND